MTTKCDRCGKPVNGARLCFECFCELAEEESMILRVARYYPNKPVWRSSMINCDHCWPFDCGCRI